MYVCYYLTLFKGNRDEKVENFGRRKGGEIPNAIGKWKGTRPWRGYGSNGRTTGVS